MYSSNYRTNALEPTYNINVTDITGMPYLITFFEMKSITVIPA
jgi:hypothetical protein